jgi:hypothetical protein
MITINLGPQWLVEFLTFVLAFTGLGIGVVIWAFILMLASIVLTEVREWVLKKVRRKQK